MVFGAVPRACCAFFQVVWALQAVWAPPTETSPRKSQGNTSKIKYFCVRVVPWLRCVMQVFFQFLCVFKFPCAFFPPLPRFRGRVVRFSRWCRQCRWCGHLARKPAPTKVKETQAKLSISAYPSSPGCAAFCESYSSFYRYPRVFCTFPKDKLVFPGVSCVPFVVAHDWRQPRKP